MAQLSTGTISLSEVNTNLSIGSTTNISLNQANVRSIAGIPSGTISMNNLRGKTSYSQTLATFSTTGGTQYYTIPSGVTTIRVKVWGGGGAASSGPTGPVAGGGGYIQGDIAVTPGQTLTINVGAGGIGWSDTEGYGGSAFPAGGNGANFGGGGGGRSEVFYASSGLIAGGGGGSGYSFAGDGGNGGPGGYFGANGANGTNSCNGGAGNCFGGGGGTISAGGAGGIGSGNTGFSGGYNFGGNQHNSNIPGGAGGDGYYGGGAGGSGLTGCGDAGGGGGGGCSYGYGVSNLQYLNGSNGSPGGVSDVDRPTSGRSVLGNYGAGQGANTSGYRGGNGYVVIKN